MAKNIEIKARCHDPVAFKKQLDLLPAKLEGDDIQVDTFYNVPDGRLKLRESSLYGSLLIPYLRANQKGPKQADYSLIKIEDVEKVKSLLSSILGVKGILRKKRRIYIFENVRIHLDAVENLGNFIEFEAVLNDTGSESENRTKVECLLKHFKITPQDLIEKAYIELDGI